jgi:hypothetical protein
LAGDNGPTREGRAEGESGRRLRLLPESMSIARLEPTAATPGWAEHAGFSCVFRTDVSLSIVCAQSLVPGNIRADRDWRCLEVEGSLDLTLTGILASLTAPLAQAGIPVFALSSYETDYILVKGSHLDAARHALEESGCVVIAD